MKTRWLVSSIVLVTVSCGGAGPKELAPVEADLPVPTTAAVGEDRVAETVVVEPAQAEVTDTEVALPTAVLEPTYTQEIPTNTPFPTATRMKPAAPAAIIARTEGWMNSFFLVGGSLNGGWVSGEDVAAVLAADQEYRLYTAFESAGGHQGQSLEFEPICKDYFVGFGEMALDQSAVGVAADWGVLPRTPQELAVDNEVYLQAVAGWLVEQAPSQPIVVIEDIWRVDIEGDGTDEVFIGASRFAEPTGHNVEPRDYSVVLMRKVVGNDVVTVELVGDYYPEAAELQFPLTYHLEFVGDLNGDGRLEVVVGVSRWEGSGVLVFEINGDQVEQVLSVMCSQ